MPTTEVEKCNWCINRYQGRNEGFIFASKDLMKAVGTVSKIGFRLCVCVRHTEISEPMSWNPKQ